MPSVAASRAWLPYRPLRAGWRAAKAVLSPTTPMLAQLVVIRRCNLVCGYCNEYDDHSPPVPADVLIRRLDHLADLGTLVVTLTGGEPLLHPQLDEVVAHAVRRGMVCTSISNAYPITPGWIERLNHARLSWLQVSVDNIEPNEVSQKSWSKIKRKLQLLKEQAKFSVNVNAVLGSCTAEQTELLLREVKELGFFMTVGLLHNSAGQIDAGLLGDDLQRFHAKLQGERHRNWVHGFGEGWEQRMLATGKAPWKCRAGARYLYIDEFGKVSFCSQRRGEPGIDVLDYGRAELRQAFHTPKGCEASCTLACVRRASSLDGWRPQGGPPVLPKPRLHLPVAG